MKRCSLLILPALALLLAVPQSASSCSLCMGKLKLIPTFRAEATQPQARMILLGNLQNPTLGTGGVGVTELHITQVLRSDPWLKDRKMVKVPRYIPVQDPKKPPQFLLFCDIFRDQLDPYRGLPVKSSDAADYVKKAMALGDKDPVAALQFYFRYLDHADQEIANDAFMEFAKTPDNVIGQAAAKLPVDRLRRWVSDPATPSEKLALFAYMLGVVGNESDASTLHTMLNDGSERISNAHDGILSGLMHLRPREGWDMTHAILRDGSRPFQQRLAAVRAVRFYHGWQPDRYRPQILKALEIMIDQGELADLAIEDMRKWKIWDGAAKVLALYGKKGYDAPVMKRAVLFYAMSAPRNDEAVSRFVAERRKAEPEAVREVEEALQGEK